MQSPIRSKQHRITKTPEVAPEHSGRCLGAFNFSWRFALSGRRIFVRCVPYRLFRRYSMGLMPSTRRKHCEK